MKRVIWMLTLAMMALAGPALATIHPLSNAECANESASVVAQEQIPPGISDFDEANFARPVIAASGETPSRPKGQARLSR